MNNDKEIIFFLDHQFFQIDDSMIWQPISIDTFESKNNDVNIYIDSSNFSLIPDEIFDQLSKDQKEIFLTSNPKDFYFFNTPVPQLSGKLFWCEKNIIIESINAKIPGCNLNHFISPMITKKLSQNQLKYFLNKDFIYIVCIKEKKIKIANRFIIKNTDDALYFILSLIKESDLINSNFNFECHGENNGGIIKKLKTIFPNHQFNIHPQSDLKSIFN